MTHSVSGDARNPVTFIEKARKCSSLACVSIGVITILPLGVRVAYDLAATILPTPIKALGSLTGSAIKFIVKDYTPAMGRYLMGSNVAGDYTTVAIGTAIAVSTMVIGCICFGNPKKRDA